MIQTLQLINSATLVRIMIFSSKYSRTLLSDGLLESPLFISSISHNLYFLKVRHVTVNGSQPEDGPDSAMNT